MRADSIDLTHLRGVYEDAAQEVAPVHNETLLALIDTAAAAMRVKLDCPHLNHAPKFTLCPEQRLREALSRFTQTEGTS
jgi:hypothetical protein